MTGVSSELGLATAGRLIGEGATVLAGTRDPSSSDLPSAVAAIELDVTDPAAWERVRTEIESSGDGLHGLVNIAAAVRTGPLIETTAADLALMLDVNLLGPALGIRTLAPLIAASGGGSIVNVASAESAMRGASSAATYSATQWGLRGLTRSAALELGSQGIRVNTVCPATGLISRSPSALADDGAERSVTSGDVAAMVAFLLSDDSATCSGGDFLVDAGVNAG